MKLKLMPQNHNHDVHGCLTSPPILPRRVDIPLPAHGLGGRLNDMIAWCRERVAAGQWDQHDYTERKPGEMPVDYARFYLATAEAAEAFRGQCRIQRENEGVTPPLICG